MDKDELEALAVRVEASILAGTENNALDVLCEVALFQPDARYASARSNHAGSKVIYTDHGGKETTCWPMPWSERSATPAALRAQGSGR